MAWPIKFSVFAAMIVLAVEGQTNQQYYKPAPSDSPKPPTYSRPAPAYPPQYPQPAPPASYNPPPANYPPPSQYSYDNQNKAPPASSGYAPLVPGSVLNSHDPAAYRQRYLTYTKQPVDCTDQTCKPNECCESNGQKRKVCMLQPSDRPGYCTRPKRCDNTGDCPTNHCCVIRLDVPTPSLPHNSYGASYGAYVKKEKEERGECIVSAQVAEACRRSVDGHQTSACPCSSGLTCIFPTHNPLIGMCS